MAGGMSAVAYTHGHPDKTAEFLRSIFGVERTSEMESVALSLEDRYNQLAYRLGFKKPSEFLTRHVEPIKLAATPVEPVEVFPAETDSAIAAVETINQEAPFVLPETHPILGKDGEGVWSADGLPDPGTMMAWTKMFPDRERPNSAVAVLIMDKRHINLHMVAGTDDGGGPGVIPEEDRSGLLAGWNGGFRPEHASWGLRMNGVTYKDLQNGWASLVSMSDGSFKMGEWGSSDDFTLTDDVVSVRQNGPLMIKDCELTPAASGRGGDNNTWGYVNPGSPENITWRTAVALTANGDLMVAIANLMTAGSLARGLKEAGACTAMQLDINTPYSDVVVFNGGQPSFLRSDNADPYGNNRTRFQGRQAHDFMYATRR